MLYWRLVTSSLSFLFYLTNICLSRFVLYQMSKNMNRRLFFMFVTKLAKVPRSEILNLLPQIRVVKAFQGSLKKAKNIKEKNKEEQSSDANDKEEKDTDNKFACFIPKREASTESKEDEKNEDDKCRRKRRDSDEEDDDEDCSRYTRRKDVEEEKSNGRKHVGTQMSPHRDARSISAYEMSPHYEQKSRSAYDMSFGAKRYRR